MLYTGFRRVDIKYSFIHIFTFLGGFVYVEDVNRLQNQINGLRFQMNVLKHLLVGLGKLHNQVLSSIQSCHLQKKLSQL